MERDFALRVSNKGMDRVRAEWKAFGPEGAASLRVIDAASTKVTPSLKAVDDAAKGIRERFNQLAGQVPVIGGFLQGLGPAGLAAGAGLMAVGAAAKALWDQGQKAREALDQIKTSADNIGTSAETFQVLTAAALEADIGIDKVTEAMGKLRLSSALASKGKGELAETLKKLNPELLKEITLAETQEDRWNIVSRAITNQTSETEKIIIAKAAFGEQGGKLVRLLDGEGNTIEALTAKYREMGLVIDEKLVAAVAEADRRMDIHNKRMEVDGIRAGAAMVPVIEAISGAWNGAWINLGNYLDGWNELEKRQLPALEARLKQLQEEVFLRGKGAADAAFEGRGGGKGLINTLLFGEMDGAELDRRMAEIRTISAMIDARKRELNKGKVDTGIDINDAAANEKAASDAARLAAERLREQQALEKQAIAIRKEAGDWSGVYAQKVAELDAVVGKYGVTQEMVNAILLKYRHELDGTADAQARYTALMEGQKSAVDKIHDRMAQARLDERSGGITPEQLRQEMAALNTELEAAVAAANPAADAIARLADAQASARTETFETAFAMETLNGVFNEQIKSLEDLEDIAIYTFKRIALAAIDSASQVKGAGLGDIFGAVLGAFGFGGASASAPASSTGFGGGLGGAGVKQMHGGGVVGDASLVGRAVPMAMFANAPRFHSGLAPDEFPTILQRGERVLSASHNERMVRAIETGGGGGNVNVVIRDETGAKFDASASRNANGDIDLEIFVRQGAAKGAASGDLDTVMLGRYGIPRKVN